MPSCARYRVAALVVHAIEHVRSAPLPQNGQVYWHLLPDQLITHLKLIEKWVSSIEFSYLLS